jgi:hypothetical protein
MCRLGDVLGGLGLGRRGRGRGRFVGAVPSRAEVDGAEEEREAGSAADGDAGYGARAE